MRKIINRVISQVVAVMISVQMIGQYGASLIPQINAVSDEVQSEVSAVEEEPADTESSDEIYETEKELESVVNEIVDDGKESETTAESEYEDWTVTSDTMLNEMKEVNNLTISSGTLNLNEQKVIVHGDLILTQNGLLDCNKGEISCENFIMSNSSYLYMKNTNDLIVVNGNFTQNGGYIREDNAVAGTIEIKGDFVSEGYSFNPTKEHKVILSGTTKQTINFRNNSYGFNILEINNTSREGVYSQKSVLANEINLMNNGKINFAGCTEYGKALDDDLVIDGDYYLAAGVLEIGDNELTVNGNLIQGGGTIKLGTGTLTVNGDYRIQSRIEKENVAEGETEKYNYGSSTGSLEMTNAECSVIVKDNFITQSTISHKDRLTAGTMRGDGNFEQISSNANSKNFVSTENHTVQFNGKDVTHEINLSSSSSYFNILDITNTTIDLKRDNVYVRKELKGESGKIIGNKIYLPDAKLPRIINGNVCIYGCILENDLVINGNLNFTSRFLFEDINLNGKSLTVNGNLDTYKNRIYFNNGKIICNGNCAIGKSSILYQKNAEDKLTVKGDFTYSGSGSTDNMVDGTITIGGDCTIDSDYFKSCNEHTIVFNGKEETQTIKVNSSSSFFNKVVFSGSDKIFATTCEINSFEKDPKCNVTFYGNGKSGWKLEGNDTIDGDLYLINGELDLGEYDLTITGNLIQGGGTIKLGTGTLTVSHKDRLTAGTMEIGGNFEQKNSDVNSYNFVSTDNHKVILSGNDIQNVKFESPYNSSFYNLEISNSKSVVFDSHIKLNGTISGNTDIISGSGYLCITNLSQMTETIYSGKLSVSNYINTSTLERDIYKYIGSKLYKT